jgi:hypothetical protein
MVEWRKSDKVYSDTWEPERKGDSVTGVLLGVRVVEGKTGKDFGIVDIRRENGGGDISVFQGGLGLQWSDLNPQPGDLIRITYTSDREWQGRLYKNYLLEVATNPSYGNGEVIIPAPGAGDEDVPF